MTRRDRGSQRFLAGVHVGRILHVVRGPARPAAHIEKLPNVIHIEEWWQAKRPKLARWRQPSCLLEEVFPPGDASLRKRRR